MARIPEATIERLKAEVSAERLIASSGIELKGAGKDLLGRCPFHDDREASLVVTPAKNLWHCFGCGAGGGPIDWVMKTQGVSFRHAVELLREGLPLEAPLQAVKLSTVRKLAAPVGLGAEDQVLLNQVIGYYHETLKSAPEALAYLKARGIDHPEAIDKLRLGYANRTLGLRLPNNQRVAGSKIRGQLERIGILRSSGHEHFAGSLVVPVVDEQGSVLEAYGRKITPRLRPGTPLHLYLPGPHRGVWNVEALGAHKEVILCEALIDALTFWCAGYRNVTAAYGVEGFTEDILAAFKRHGTERVLIAYDRDEAGERAALKHAEALMACGIEAWRIEFPKGMDANEYALKLGPAAKSLGVVIRKAVWLGKGKPRTTPSAEPVVTVEHVAESSPACAPAASSLAALAAKEENPEPPLPASPMLLAASPMPAAAAGDVAPEVKESEVVFTFGENGSGRRYRVRGLAKNLGYEVMKVNVLAGTGERFYVDTLDLYAAKLRGSFVVQAAAELALAEDVVKADLGKVLLKLEALQEANIRRALEPKPVQAVVMADSERAAALELLRSPDLVRRILADLDACGIVGEKTNKLVAYLAATSRKLDSPLAVLVQSSSAAGKSSLMDAVLAMMPAEERIKYSAVTGQSLFYMGAASLKHKILAIVEEEGASRASYALKLLQSEGELTIASTGKDPDTGNLVTQEYRVEGPVMMFLTTTAIEIDPELQNRCLVLSVDESREQTKAIHELQRKKRTLDGLLGRVKRAEILAVHANAQRLLRRLGVLNPYATRLTFPDTATRLRRDHEKYLTLIDTIALVHQMSREVKAIRNGAKMIEYVEVTADDIALANRLAHEVLGRSLDELPPQTRRVLGLLDRFVAGEAKKKGLERAQVRFSRRELREHLGMSDTQLRLHLDRLVALEYVLARREGPGGRIVYELVYDGAGEDGRPFVPGLIDADALKPTATTTQVAGVKGEVAGRMRADRGPVAPGSRPDKNVVTPRASSTSRNSTAKETKTHLSGDDAEKLVVPLAAARSA
jgi:DNA-binding transcriptional ArsR family regulator